MWAAGRDDEPSPDDVAVSMASSGYYQCATSESCPHPDKAVDTRDQMQDQLDNAPPSYPGMVLKFAEGIYNYLCTRNNNFSNRSQKGTLVVTNATWANGAFSYWAQENVGDVLNDPVWQ